MAQRAARLAALACTLALGACSEEQTRAASGAADPETGRQVYLAYCVSCHARDPASPGPLGPPVNGASRELLEARLLHGSYPPGYTPRRDSAVMQPMPQVAPNIPDLAAYLR